MARTKRQIDQFLWAVWLSVFRELENYWIHGAGGSTTVEAACKKITSEKTLNFDQSSMVSGEGSKFPIEQDKTLRQWFYDAEEVRHDSENHWYLWEKTNGLSDRYEAIKKKRKVTEQTDKVEKKTIALITTKNPVGRPPDPSTKRRTKTTKKVEVKDLDWNN